MNREPANLKRANLKPGHSKPPLGQTWQTVKVFISSTFRDMQAERDHLVRFVFPKLREELLKRRIHFVDVDLRWGVTSDQDAVGVCKKIIDECRPRFVCILGGRYGWMPAGKDESITAQEIHYAAIDRPDVKEYRYFYFRDPEVTKTMVETEPGEYREPTGSDSERKLVELKQSVVRAGFDTQTYRATWDSKQNRLADLREFGETVYEDLLKSVDDELGALVLAEPSEFDEADSAMDAFIQERTERYVLGSRKGLLDDMLGFAAGSGAQSVLAVTGEPGSGKSALLAKFCQNLTQPETCNPESATLVVSHFIGAGPGTTDLRRILRRLCRELARAAGDDSEVPQDVKELVQQFPDFLKKVAARRRAVLVIDALDQLDAVDNAHSMYWLPRELPENVRVVSSSLPHAALDALKLRKEQVVIREIPRLAADDSHAIVTEFLSQYQKKMSKDQTDALLAKPESNKPLYLLAALEELRTLGTYEEITARIKNLPGEAKALFHWILVERLSQDPGFLDAAGNRVGADLVRRFVSYIGASRYGMSHSELVELIEPEDPLGNIAALERLLRPYLMYRGDLLNFYHGQFREAVEGEYLDEEEERLNVHRALAEYFKRKADPKGDSTWTGNYPRGLSELPYHQTQGQMWDAVRATLTNYEFVEAKVSAGMTSDLVRDHNHAQSAASTEGVGLGEDEVFRDWGSFVSRESYRLVRLDEPFQQIACNRASGGPVVAEAEKRARGCVRPWFRLVNRPRYDTAPARLIVLEGHTDMVMSVAVTPEGRRVVSSGGDGVVRVWDMESGTCLNVLQGAALSVAVTPDGRHVVGGSFDETICVWDMESGVCLKVLSGHALPVPSVAVTPDGRRLMSGSYDSTIRVWDMESGTCLNVLHGHAEAVRSVAVTPDGRRVVSGGDDRTVRVWDLESGVCLKVLKGHNEEVASVAVTPDSRCVVSGSWDREVRVWDVETGVCLKVLQGDAGIKSVAVMPDGKHAASGHWDGTLRTWNLADGKCLMVFRSRHPVNAVAVTPDGSRLVSGGGRPSGGSSAKNPYPGELTVWNLHSEESDFHREGHAGHVIAATVTPDGGRAVTAGGDDRTIRVWDMRTGQCARVLETPSVHVNAIAATPDGLRIVTGSADGRVRVLELTSGECSLTLEHRWGSIRAVSVTHDGRHVAVGGGSTSPDLLGKSGELRIWNLGNGGQLFVLREPANVTALVVMPCRKWCVYAVHAEAPLYVLDVGSRSLCRCLLGHTDAITVLAALPDGHRVVSGSRDMTVRVWNLDNGECERVLIGHRHIVTAVAATQDGRCILSGGVDQTLRLWDLKTGTEVAHLHLDGEAMACAAGPEGRLVAGDILGRVYLLVLENVPLGLQVVTAWRRETRSNRRHRYRHEGIGLGCPFCREWSEVPEPAVGTELPCPNCGRSVKLNPFTIDADWRPIAKAWKGEKD